MRGGHVYRERRFRNRNRPLRLFRIYAVNLDKESSFRGAAATIHSLPIMRKILLVLFSLLMSLDAFSQDNMKVVSFNKLENDMTAKRLETKKLDVNGKEAALIKFVSPGTGFDFEFGSTGVVEVVHKAGEVWLYVPQRSRKLTIKHDT